MSRYSELFDALLDLPEIDHVDKLNFSQRHFVAKHLAGLGWRPPTGEMTTVEELDHLPEGTWVTDNYGEIFWQKQNGFWNYTPPLPRPEINAAAKEVLMYRPIRVVKLPEGTK